MIIIIALLGRSHAAVVQILGSPLVAIIMLLFIINTAYHMWIGMQEIILDYVHEDKLKLLSLMANTFFVFVVGVRVRFRHPQAVVRSLTMAKNETRTKRQIERRDIGSRSCRQRQGLSDRGS